MTTWDTFFREKITKIFKEKKQILDIGGGLRISKKKGNRHDPAREWIRPLLKDAEYKILDPIPDYSPDIVGDIHELPLKDESQDAVICMAVLEHVENPRIAMQEIYRVLKKDGYAFLYVPFLFYYHAEAGYYKDYWRFTQDSLEMLCSDFTQVEIINVRGALETWLHISPLGRFAPLKYTFRFLDKISGKSVSNQVSGYNVFLEK